MTDLSDLPSLQVVDRDVRVLYDRGLTSLAGMESVQRIGGLVEIKRNPVLAELGLPSLTEATTMEIHHSHDPPRLARLPPDPSLRGQVVEVPAHSADDLDEALSWSDDVWSETVDARVALRMPAWKAESLGLRVVIPDLEHATRASPTTSTCTAPGSGSPIPGPTPTSRLRTPTSSSRPPKTLRSQWRRCTAARTSPGR